MGTVDQAAYEAATRALWHHRHRAADALALLDEVLGAAQEAGVDVERLRARAREIRERPLPSAEQLPDMLDTILERALAHPSTPPPPCGDQELEATVESADVEPPSAAPEVGPGTVHRLPVVYGERRDDPPPDTAEVTRPEELGDADRVVAWAHRRWREVEIVESPRARATTVLVAYRVQGRRVVQRLALNRLRRLGAPG